VFAVLLGAVTVGAGGLYLVRQGPGGVGACPQPVLRVVAAPDIAPLIRTAATRITGRCPAATVTAQEPAETVRDMRARPPDVWVPSSTAWLRIAGAADDAYPSVGRSLARSPLVVAAPRPLAQTLGWPGRQPTWAELAAKTYSREIPRFSMPDPLRATAGLLAVLGVDIAVAQEKGAGAASMRKLTFRSRLADANADPARLLRQVTAVPDPARDVGLFPVTEQALWSSLKTSNLKATDAHAMVAMYPPDGLLEADYPLLISREIQQDAVRRALTDRLAAWFSGSAGVRTLADRGFRPPSQAANTTAQAAPAAPAAEGLLPRYGPVSPLPTDASAVVEAATVWSRFQRMPFRVLLLVDASASMGEPVGEGGPVTGSVTGPVTASVTTKATLLRKCAGDAVQLFGEDTSAAMWLFPSARPNGPPFTEVVPFGPLDDRVDGASRRKLLARAFVDYQPSPRVGTPLYETVLQGREAMRQRYRPDAVTLVFVLTDGNDSGTTGRAAFLARLAAGNDPSRPVPIFGVGYGPGADMTALREAARITGGQAIAADNPRDVEGAVAAVFLAAHRARSG
jgi:hypothetical protein